VDSYIEDQLEWKKIRENGLGEEIHNAQEEMNNG
jgi:hypothetical protein